jgi:LmbE family N-acetylglucosaminyl deacetylase
MYVSPILYRCKSAAKLIGLAVLVYVIYITTLRAQRELSGAAEAKLAIDRLDVVGSVLMIAAHPDDENTALLAYLARGRKVRTGYLSLTRGEGGQNLIGAEQGDELGLIRTEELLAARRIDGAEQFFTRAIDFGFTKTSKETFEKWGHEKILSDVVWVVRRFQPDVIVLRFTGTPRDGHGQHQASAILGKEAFSAAADPKRFPEQLRWVQPWQARRLMWNGFAFNSEQEKELDKESRKIEVDAGDYDPLLGHSYTEIAGMSRSMHRSQGMGTAERKGSNKNYLLPVEGEAATRDPFDGVDITWNRFPGGAAVGRILGETARAFDPTNPAKSVPSLLAAQKLVTDLHVAELSRPLLDLKRRELEETIALCSGLWLDAAADKFAVVPGGALKLSATALNRERLAIEVNSIDLEGMAQGSVKDSSGALPFNTPKVYPLDIAVASTQPLSQPYWLREPKQGDTYTVSDQTEIGLPENPPLLRAHFHLRIENSQLEIVRPVIYRYVERAQGELTRAIVVEPPVALEWSEEALLFPSPSAKSVELQVRANVARASGGIRVQAPAGWNVNPSTQDFKLSAIGQESPLSFHLTPSAQDSQGSLEASAKVGDQTIAVGMETISYPHIPPQVLFKPARTELVRSDVRLLAKTVGYVMGAGDEVPHALRQMGADVTLLGADDLAHGDLSRFDAIVTGVRAYNTRPELRANQERLLEYVRNGGTMVVQYNVPEGGGPAPTPGRGGNGRGPASADSEPTVLDHIGPYPLTTGRDRVTVEEAPVELPNRTSPLLHKPNEITARDFEGWVQERGLNFASEWDSHYQPLFETHDPGEKALLGGTLYTRYGKGAYVFTAFSWFRELPAGVPGAFRIFANLLSAGKTL